ncbi:MAG: hypothetical protein IKQ31_01550 [Clostridia bacterium]|nr:hypothetical protein [Clostridia bacterium]
MKKALNNYEIDKNKMLNIAAEEERLDDDEISRLKEALCSICDEVTESDAEKFISNAEDVFSRFGTNALLRCQFEALDLINTFFNEAETLEECISVYETDVHYKTHFKKFDNIDDYATFMEEYHQSIIDKLNDLNAQLPLIKQKLDEGIKISKHTERMAKNTYDIVRKSDENALRYIKGLELTLVNSSPPTTIPEAIADAKEYYKSMKKNSESFEFLKNNLPKTTRLKNRIKQAQKENISFIATCRNNAPTK